MPFSFCLIGKNEEKRLDKCLSPLKNTGKEILFLDTGSTDSTVAIAKKYTPNVHYFEWCNDFSAARNFAAGKASRDYVLFIDCDEYLEEINLKEMEALIRDYPHAIGRITRRNECNSSSGNGTIMFTDLVERLYHRDYFHYEGKIHEQVTSSVNAPLEAYELPLVVFHDGYVGTKEELAQKANRNIRLLLEDLEEDPSDPYTYYQLGQAYALMSDHENAYRYYHAGCQLPLDSSLEYVRLMLTSYGHSLIQAGKSAKAPALIERYPGWEKDADFVCMLGFAYLEDKKIVAAIKEFKHALTLGKSYTEGSNSFYPAHNLGCIYEALENETDALFYYDKAGDYPSSVTRKEALLLRLKEKDTRNDKYSSHIIYCNNCGNALPALLEAYENQTLGMAHLELIFVDAASIDNTLDLLTAFEQKHPESVILLPLSELVSKTEAYSIGLNYASSPYVGFFTPWNIPSEDFCRHLFRAGQAYHADILACNNSAQYPEFHLAFDSKEQAKSLFASGILSLSLTGKLFKRELLVQSPFSFPFYEASDKELTLLLLLMGNSIYFYGQEMMQEKPAILLFSGISPILDYLSREYQKALESLGQPTVLFAWNDFETSAKQILSLGKENFCGVLSMNNIGFSFLKKDGSNLWQEWNLPCFNLLVDHPMYYADTLDAPPAGGTVLCADENHVLYNRRMYSSIAQSDFLPTAGTVTLPYGQLPSFSERAIDILLLGNYKYHSEITLDENGEKIMNHLKQHPGDTLEDAATLFFAKENLLPLNTETNAFYHNPEFVKNHFPQLKKWIENYRFIETNLCSLYREEAMLLLLEKGITVEAYGNGWENSRLTTFSNFRLHPPVAPAEGLKLMQNSKIVFNNMAWFKKGGSERVFNAALQGAVILSDLSLYLADIFDEEAGLFYSLERLSDIPDMVTSLLADSKKAEMLRQNAYMATISNHTWLHRGQQFLSFLSKKEA